MNKCEDVMLDSMVNLNMLRRTMTMDNHAEHEVIDKILLLLNCVTDWRYPTSEPLESGCGKLVQAGDAE